MGILSGISASTWNARYKYGVKQSRTKAISKVAALPLSLFGELFNYVDNILAIQCKLSLI